MSAWDKTFTHNVLLAIDLWAALTFFNRAGITISTMAGLVRDGKAAPLKLWLWQEDFLRWLEPRLSNAHCEAAKAADIARAELALQLMK
jgi:hypothetical protein